jgi:hypothetical protein
LSTETVKIIRERLKAGEKHASIARDLGVNRYTISRINQNKSYKYV